MGSTNINIVSNICNNSLDWGIEVGGIFNGNHNNIVVSNNIVNNSRNAGIGYRSVNNGVITSNTIQDCGNTSVWGSDAITLIGDTHLCEKVNICSNVIKGGSGAIDGIRVTNYQDVIISGNTISNVNTGINFEGETNRSVLSSSIRGNTIYSASIGCRVLCNVGSTIENIEIQNNKIVSGQYGISITANNQIKYLAISGNKISDCNYQGILLYNLRYITLSDNFLKNCGKGNNGGNGDNDVAILVVGCSDCIVNGTNAFDTGTLYPMLWALRAHDCTNFSYNLLTSVGARYSAFNGYNNQ